MAKITVDQLQELGEYGKKVKDNSKQFKAAVVNANYQFALKYKGSEGDVIKAFVEKLNTIQNQVFDIYPGYLDYFGAVMENYDTGLSGLGFATKAWSQDGEAGAQGVQQKLVGDQKKKVEAIRKSLDVHYTTAATILGSGKISAEAVYNDASAALDDAGGKRSQLDSSMQEFYKSFVDGLNTSQAQLKAILEVLNNARYIGSLEPSTVVNAIAEKRLTNPDDLKMLDAIQDSGDAAMVTAILSGDKFREMGKVDATHVSSNMSAYAYAQFAGVKDLGSSDNINDLEAFISELQKQDPDKVKIYMEKLSAASAQQGYISVAQGLRLFPDFPAERTPEAMANYIDSIRGNNEELAEVSANLRKHAHLAGLFDSLYLLDVGTRYNTYGAEIKLTQTTLSDLGYTAQGFGYKLTQLETDVTNNYTISKQTFNIAVDNYLEAESVHFDQMSEKIEKLEASKKQAVLDFIGDVAQAGIYLLPGGVPAKIAVNLFGDIAKKTGSNYASDFADYLKDFRDAVPKDYRTTAVSSLSVLKAPFKLYEKLEKINKDIKEAKDAQLYSIFNVGGVSVNKDGKVVKAEYTPAYDLDAFLTMKDLADNGLSAHVYRQALTDGKSPEEALAKLNEFESNVNKPDVLSVSAKNFALGRPDVPASIGAVGQMMYEERMKQEDRDKALLNKMQEFNAQEIWNHYQDYGRNSIIPDTSDQKNPKAAESAENLKKDIQDDFNRIAQGRF